MMTTQRDADSAQSIVLKRLDNRPIVLVGLMGAGKSAIGRKLATRLGLRFVDADREIEKAANMTIPDIFSTYGEDEFRRLEASVMARLLDGGAQVLATGGGAFMNAETRQEIARTGVSVWLSADLNLLMKRVARKTDRPLLRDADPRGVMQRLIDERYPVYAGADVEIVSRDVGKDQMVDAVLAGLANLLSNDAPVAEVQSDPS